MPRSASRAIAASAMTLGLLAAPAIASPVQADEWLYVLNSPDIQVLPGMGDNGRILLRSDIGALQFTDRPNRRSAATTVRSFLRDFDWNRQTGVLDTKAPNAAVAIDGDLTQPVEIRRAKVTKNKVTLYVRGLAGPLNADRGQGAVFVDDASGEQSTSLSPQVSAQSTYNSDAPSITVTLRAEGTVMWSGTLTPASPSATIPNSSGAGASASGSVRATFNPQGGGVATFTGTVTDNGEEPINANVEIASWSPDS